MKKSIDRKTALLILAGFVLVVSAGIGLLYYNTLDRLTIQFDIHQNKEAIYLSTFAEPPQFAIWIENPDTDERNTVFVTGRAGTGDWEGKPNVPVALPRWFELFTTQEESGRESVKDGHTYAVTGATPKEDFFSVRIEVPPGSEWICWIEMNLAGDFNEAFPEFNDKTLEEDEFSCGQPALLYRARIKAVDGTTMVPDLVSQSVWEDGKNRVEPLSDGITTAKDVFDVMEISVSKPKIKLIEDDV